MPPSTTVPTLSVPTATTPTAPIQPVQPAPATGNTELAGLAGANADQFQQQLDTNAANAKQAYETPLSQYVSALASSKGQSGLTADAYDQDGVNTDQQALTDVNSRILAEQNATQQSITKLKNTNGQGFFGTGLDQAVQKIQDQSDARLANMSVEQAAASGNYSNAKAIADRAVQAQYEQQQNYLTALSSMADAAKTDWTTAESQDFDAALATRQSDLDTQKTEQLAQYNEQIQQSDPKYQAELATARINAGLDPTTGRSYTSGGDTGTVVNGYQLGASDSLGAYASDTATQVQNVQATVDKITSSVGTVSTPAQAQAALETVAPNSPITGDMVMQAAQKYGVDPSVVIGVMQAETQCGTDGSTGAQQCNWGNVGNTDTAMAAGKPVAMTPQQGVDAVAQNLAQRKTGAAGGSSSTNSDGAATDSNVPQIVKPYVSTSTNGTQYADLSSVQGTAAQKSAIVNLAQNAGVKVITNKDTALDLTNIKDANSKLDTIGNIISTISQPGWVARDLYGVGLTGIASKLQSDPQKAAAANLQSVGLDILKAISGVQGFRGNSAVVAQINEHLPTIYDTQATAQTKISYIRDLLNDRENAILGTNSKGPDQYASYRSQVPAGQILIMRNGQVGTVPESEFDPSIDQKL